MSGWQVISTARRVTYCPIALALRDEFSGGGPLSTPQLLLDRLVGTSWQATGIAPVLTSGGIFGWPGLGRSPDPAVASPAHVRVRIALAHQIALYQSTDDGLEFDIPPYNDAQPPAATMLMPQIVLLVPGPSYPFSPGLRVLRGRVLDAGGQPVSDATIVADGIERAMSGTSGGFSLPLRWQQLSGNVAIDVTHPRSGMAASVQATLPGDLAQSFDITVS